MSANLKRYRVRPAGNEDPDCEFDVEAKTAPDAAMCVASAVGDDAGHVDRRIEVWVVTEWVAYDCRPKQITVYEVSRAK